MAYWTIVISVFCYVGISALTGKGYLCRDPDTGKLYPVNSTWPSSSFCGNYTCKLRKKDMTKTVIPIREIVIPSISPKPEAKSPEEETMETAASTNVAASTILSILQPSIFTESSNSLTTTTASYTEVPHSDNTISSALNPLTEKLGDRYLNEEEIKSISTLLYSVKKSDLEAIVDIYNLAQDIYKEMDKITSQSILEDTVQAAKSIQKNEIRKSYWYEPLRTNKVGISGDMEVHGTHAYPTAVEKSTTDPYSYFQGPLTKNDFGYLPYYYSMSNYQRDHSYVHGNNQQNAPNYEKPHCTQSTPYQYTPSPEIPKPSAPVHYSYYSPQTYGIVNKPYPVETQKDLQPSVLLPYPFSSVQHYNMSAYPYHLYFSGNPWTYPQITNKNNENPEQYFKAYQPQINDNSIQSLTEIQPSNENQLDSNIESQNNSSDIQKEDKQNKQSGPKNLLDSLIEQAKIEPKSKPEWQTDPLASNVLEEIKAHFEEKVKLLKPLSLRKKTKLERVGKVLKLDDLNRDRRSVVDVSTFEVVDEDYEAYVEKTTCRPDTDLGFYQMGNISEPYPACCPKKIEHTQR